jgi:hypothetical protein
MANIATMHTLAEKLYDINLTGHTQTLEVTGPPGCAKTAFARQFAGHMAKKMGLELGTTFGFAIRHISTEDPLDSPGVLHIKDNPDGTSRAERTYPGLFPQPWEFPNGKIPEHGILVWDEWGQGDHDQHKSAASGVDERRLGRFQLPNGWMIILTSNRVHDRASVGKPLTFITTRKVTVPMEFDADLYVHWLKDQGVHHKLRGFVSANASTVQSPEVPDHDNPYSTSRTFFRACLQLMAFEVVDEIGTEEHMTPTARLARETVLGTVGEGVGIRLFGYLRHCETMVKMEDILKDPKRANVPDRPDVMWAVVQMLASYADEQSKRPDGGGDLMPAFTYLKRLPENFQMSGVRMIAKANKKLLLDARYSGWVRENRELIMSAVAAENRARGR